MPSPEAVAWGKRQASTSPRWTDDKWNEIGTIFGLNLVTETDPGQQETEALPDAA